MLEYIVETTNAFLDQMPKSQRKKKGQFFTSSETAVFISAISSNVGSNCATKAATEILAKASLFDLLKNSIFISLS